MRLKLAWLAILLFYCTPGFALDLSSRYQAHIRMGLLSGTYSGPGIDGRKFAVPTTMEAELEVFTEVDESFNLRAIMAMELETNRVHYTYAGFGKSNYLLGRGRKDVRTEKAVSAKLIPRTRYYWGWNLGISQVLVVPYGLVLASYSTTLDASFNFGMIYQISENLGFEVRGGLGMGYGFSAVTVTGVTTSALIGLAYFL